MALASNEYKTLFIHIYKCGGTTVRHAMKGDLQEILGGHAVAGDVRRHLGESWYNEYFSFSFMRNPYDWMLSLYGYVLKYNTHYLHEVVQDMEFNDFIDFYIEDCKTNIANTMHGANRAGAQHEYVMEDGQVIVNYIGNLETLKHDMRNIARLSGCDFNKIGHHNHVDHPERCAYNSKGIALMKQHYKQDFELGNYGYAI